MAPLHRPLAGVPFQRVAPAHPPYPSHFLLRPQPHQKHQYRSLLQSLVLLYLGRPEADPFCLKQEPLPNPAQWLCNS